MSEIVFSVNTFWPRLLQRGASTTDLCCGASAENAYTRERFVRANFGDEKFNASLRAMFSHFSLVRRAHKHIVMLYTMFTLCASDASYVLCHAGQNATSEMCAPDGLKWSGQ